MVRCWEREATVLQQLPMGGGKWDTKKTAAGGAKQGQGRVENEAMHNRAWKVCVRASRAGCGQGTTLQPPPTLTVVWPKSTIIGLAQGSGWGKIHPKSTQNVSFGTFLFKILKKLFSKQFLTFFREPSGLVQASLAGGGVRGQEKKSVTPEAVACSPEAATPSLYGILDIQKHEQPRKTRLLVCVLDIFDFGLLGPIYESQVVLLTRYLLLVECHFFGPIFFISLWMKRFTLKKNFLLEFSLADQKMGPSTSHPWGFSPPNIFKALDHNKIHSCHCSLGLRSKGTNISH